LRNMATGEQKTMKYKKAAPMVDSGQWVVED
jgi:hypothetical protein